MQVDTKWVTVRVPVHVLGRNLRYGPILLVPVHRLDQDALQADTPQVDMALIDVM